jgi:hypothetical protein
MLRLPIPSYRLRSDCMFSCAQSLLALIGGISTMLYAHRDGKPGKDFQNLLVEFYPWNEEPNSSVTPSEGARIIYNVFRNPLTHNLGAHVRPRSATPRVKLKRAHRKNGPGGLTERTIERLEQTNRLDGISPAIVVRQDDATVLYVEALYWGVRVMLSRLLHDHSRMAKAELYLAKIS